MDELKEIITERFEDFWYDIYNDEKEEIKRLEKYINYVDKETRNIVMINNKYEQILNLFMNKHLDYLKEAFTSIILKNYNAFACLMRIIIENYVSFYLIKKHKKEELWKDWILWSNYKILKYVDKEPYHTEIKTVYEKLCESSNVDSNYITSARSYSWLKKIGIKDYSFRNVSELVSSSIYEDYSYLSDYIHNNDIYSKTNFVDMKLLTKFLFILYDYTDKMIQIYNHYIIRRKEYNNLCISLLESLDNCCLYYETE